MRVLGCLALAHALAATACTFDGSGSLGEGGDDTAPDAAGSLPVDAAPPIDAAPPPVDAMPPPVDGLTACDFDFVCDPGEDPATCFDCGGGFVCDFDQMCEAGESDECLECLFP